MCVYIYICLYILYILCIYIYININKSSTCASKVSPTMQEVQALVAPCFTLCWMRNLVFVCVLAYSFISLFLYLCFFPARGLWHSWLTAVRKCVWSSPITSAPSASTFNRENYFLLQWKKWIFLLVCARILGLERQLALQAQFSHFTRGPNMIKMPK